MKTYFILLILILFSKLNFPEELNQIVVAQDGTGDYNTISEAIGALPIFNYGRVTIFIKNGV